jgi:hypothetical protein
MRAELELSQPGLIHQPVPFQTNQYWAEEIQAGPGPPRGWRRHSLDDGAKRVRSDKKSGKKRKKSVFAPGGSGLVNEMTAPTNSSSDTAAPTSEGPAPRLSRRASSAGAASTLDALKDTIKSTIALPDTWNWKRYEREDETLFGINDRISRMWDRATQHGRQASTDRGQPLTPGRRRAATVDSDDHSWLYARNPGVNDLHPPTVSQLPRTKREVAWMMQPAPSRAVMEGKIRPATESGNRRPLCTVGAPVAPLVGTPLKRDEASQQLDVPPDLAPHPKRPPDTIISPGYTATDEAEEQSDYDDEDDEEEEGEGEEEREGEAEGEEEEGAEEKERAAEGSSNPSYFLSHHHSSFHTTTSTPNPTRTATKIPHRPHPHPHPRPPLALLVNSRHPSKFTSYHFPSLSPSPSPSPSPNHPFPPSTSTNPTHARPHPPPLTSLHPREEEASEASEAPRGGRTEGGEGEREVKAGTAERKPGGRGRGRGRAADLQLELDVWMGLVLPQLPERERFSLPNVRLGE